MIEIETDPRKKQVITTKKRHGPTFYSDIAKLSKGGGFNDPEVARRAAQKMWANRRAQKEKEHASSTTPAADQAS